MKWKVVYTKQAQRDSKKIKESGLKDKTEILIDLLSKDPFKSPPSFEKITGDLSGAYSRRINIQHRLIYLILKKEKIVKIIKMWIHYE